MSVWFTSDLHFGHDMVARTRGYASAEEHDQDILETLASCIRKQDQLWILGDLSIKNGAKLHHIACTLGKLVVGTKHLVAGNHDPIHPMHRDAHTKGWIYRDTFESVQTAARRKVLAGGKYVEVLLSHFPYAGEGERDIPDRHTQWRLPNQGAPIIHGHTHSRRLFTTDMGTPQIHVGWDARERPVDLDEIQAQLEDLL